MAATKKKRAPAAAKKKKPAAKKSTAKKPAAKKAAIKAERKPTASSASASRVSPAKLSKGLIAIDKIIKGWGEKKKFELWTQPESGGGGRPPRDIIREKKKVERELPPGSLRGTDVLGLVGVDLP
jgi:hypothetical protein